MIKIYFECGLAMCEVCLPNEHRNCAGWQAAMNAKEEEAAQAVAGIKAKNKALKQALHELQAEHKALQMECNRVRQELEASAVRQSEADHRAGELTAEVCPHGPHLKIYFPFALHCNELHISHLYCPMSYPFKFVRFFPFSFFLFDWRFPLRFLVRIFSFCVSVVSQILRIRNHKFQCWVQKRWKDEVSRVKQCNLLTRTADTCVAASLSGDSVS
jgi:regulator of replication initiation timing